MSRLSVLPRIALAQMAVRPGRPDLNVARMLELIDEARDAGAAVVAFPELCVPGYIIGDLWEVDALVEDFVGWSDVVRDASAGLTVVFGNVAIDRERIGEDGRLRKFNAAYVCHDGAYLRREGVPEGLPDGVHIKTLHPNYRFFDDDRHFCSLRKLAASQGRAVGDWLVPFEVPGGSAAQFKFGVQLCEDIWCQDYEHQRESLDTLQIYHASGADAVVNLSSSPWTWQKSDKRNRTVHEVLGRSPLPLFYVNQVGALNNGKNILVFDGDSTAYSANGDIVAQAAPWEEQLLLCGSPEGNDSGQVAAGSTSATEVESEVASVYHGVLAGLRHLDHIRDAENQFLVGVSGGVDSSVVVCLLERAFGAERVLAVNLPTRFNADVTRDNASTVCAALGVDYVVAPIDALYQAVAERIRSVEFDRHPGRYSQLVDENLQARIRGADMLAGLAAKQGVIFTNNGNKTEIALGYATLYGDVNGAVAPLGDLYKTQVFELARYLNRVVYERDVIPVNLYDGTTVPSAELSADQDVTRGLGDPIKYGYHDAVLRQMIEYRHHPIDFLRWFAEGVLLERLQWSEPERFRQYFPSARDWVLDLEWVDAQLSANIFKRIQAPPIIVLSKRAFGFDLRESQLPGSYVPRAYPALRERVLEMDPLPR